MQKYFVFSSDNYGVLKSVTIEKKSKEHEQTLAELNSVYRRSQANYPLVQTSYSLRYLQAYPKSGALPRKMPTDPVIRMQLKKRTKRMVVNDGFY